MSLIIDFSPRDFYSLDVSHNSHNRNVSWSTHAMHEYYICMIHTVMYTIFSSPHRLISRKGKSQLSQRWDLTKRLECITSFAKSIGVAGFYNAHITRIEEIWYPLDRYSHDTGSYLNANDSNMDISHMWHVKWVPRAHRERSLSSSFFTVCWYFEENE